MSAALHTGLPMAGAKTVSWSETFRLVREVTP